MIRILIWKDGSYWNIQWKVLIVRIRDKFAFISSVMWYRHFPVKTHFLQRYMATRQIPLLWHQMSKTCEMMCLLSKRIFLAGVSKLLQSLKGSYQFDHVRSQMNISLWTLAWRLFSCVHRGAVWGHGSIIVRRVAVFVIVTIGKLKSV